MGKSENERRKVRMSGQKWGKVGISGKSYISTSDSVLEIKYQKIKQFLLIDAIIITIIK